MDAERWERVEAVLDLALDHEPSEWPAIVAAACGDDHALRAEVEALLREHGRAQGLLDSGAGSLAAQFVQDVEHARAVDALEGTTLGVWQVGPQIGHGGMSRVFLGERVDGTFAQRVAIKVLRAGLDTPGDVERFRMERQILATLDHPHIAHLLDGGVTPDGRPYLVLEYIEGEPLTTYCRKRTLDTATRIRLFLKIVDATQSAHRQLIVHRDLKPSNILVSADGQPRLLDFGIAKIVDPTGGSASEATATRRRWFTPEYAAPEQFTGAPVSTATDVYQLGAVLYELLCGHRAFERTLAGRPLEDRVVPDDTPPPSMHLSALRGDLDAVILKALRKEPTARYASVAEFGADLKRVLDSEPVAARTGNRGYRWRRMARRRALPLSLAAAAVLTAGVYMGTLVVQNRRIAQALDEVSAERSKSDQVSAFLLGLFEAIEPARGRGDTLSARVLLDRGEARANALTDSPLAQAQMLDAIGRARMSLGAYADARPNLERALELRRQSHGEVHADVAQSIATPAKLDELAGRSAQAARGFRTALARQRELLGERAPATQRTIFDLAYTLHTSGDVHSAQPFFSELGWLAATRPNRRDVLYARQLEALGEYVEQGARGDSLGLAVAAALRAEAMRIRSASAGGPLQTSGTFGMQTGVRAGAEIGALGGTQVAATKPAPDLEALLVGYSGRIERTGRLTEATPISRESYVLAEQRYGADHLLTAAYLAGYGDVLRRSGNFVLAERVLRDAESRLTRTAGAQSLMTLRTRLFLGDVLRAIGRWNEAEVLLLPTYEHLFAERGADNVQTQFALSNVVRLYETAGRPAEASRFRALLAITADPD